MKYETGIVLGNKYRDKQTSLEGTAIAVTFWQHSCERVIIELLDSDGALQEYTFDSPRLELVQPPAQEFVQPTNGGPGGSALGRGVSGRQVTR